MSTHEETPFAASHVESAARAQPDISEITNLPQTNDEPESLTDRVKTILIGKPLNLADESIFHHLSLVAFLAWVGLGADGLSSSCYGPEEAFRTLGEHKYLAVFLALATAVTVFVISTCYSHIIEAFPSGGGGYLVASKLLGPKVGLVSGSALLVDYALTITVSIAAAGDALFGLLGAGWTWFGMEPVQWKLGCEAGAIILLIILNLRGIKESVMALLPIFLVFLATHAILIFGSLGMHAFEIEKVTHEVSTGLNSSLANPDVGLLGILLVFLHAYSLGAGTYTGIEAVSNSMPVMREPRVKTGKTTMMYMAASLALTAGGLMIGYLLLDIEHVAGKTMNHVLSERFVHELNLPVPLGTAFVLVTIIAEGALLVVAAQAGFIDGPRVLANMARDSWLPHWFASLSERLAAHNGVLLMGLAGLGALWVTQGDVRTLVIMYSINVFVTFSLSMIGMCLLWWNERGKPGPWKQRLALFACGTALCLAILGVTVYEKFEEGGWRTIGATGVIVLICLWIRRYYRRVSVKLAGLNDLLQTAAPMGDGPPAGNPDPLKPTAVVLVGGYSGLGLHTMMHAMAFGGTRHFDNLVFVSTGVVDTGNFKGAGAVEELRAFTEQSLNRYVDHARQMGIPSTGFMSIGIDPVDELEKLCVEVRKLFPRSTFFAGQLVFQRDKWYQRMLHNETAFSLQRRLQWDGVPMVILPTRVR